MTILGMSALTAGFVAVFTSANQAGTVGLLAIGAAASLFAILGKIPLRWVVAGAELDMTYDGSETAEALSEVLTAEQVERLRDRLLSEEQSPATTDAASGGLKLAAQLTRIGSLEQEWHQRLHLWTQLHPGWSYEASRAPDERGDGVLTSPTGATVVVDVKLWGDRNWPRSSKIMNAAIAASRISGADGVLFATNSMDEEAWGRIQSTASRTPRFRVATLSDGIEDLTHKVAFVAGER
jgi:hypothetical protein